MDKDLPAEQIQGIPQLETSLLPLYQKYKEEHGSWIPDFDIWSYLNLRADFDLAAAFTKMFWPDFVEVDGCVLLKHNYSPAAFGQWMERFGGDRREVESMMNHVHVLDLFLNSPKYVEYSEDLYEFLAHALMRGWKSALHDAFPDKNFVFTLRHGYGPEISFRQVQTSLPNLTSQP